MTHQSRLAGFIIDCNTTDLAAAADFWGHALHMDVRRLPAAEGAQYMRLVDPENRLHIEVQMVDHPSRVHLDIESSDVEAEATRLEALGARRVKQVHTWWVMEAPTGQRFCVVRAEPGQGALERWHALVAKRDAAALETLLADDVVFQSPALNEPQRGKELATRYLTAALKVLGGPDFRYTGEWRGADSAVLEFETRLGDIVVNGVDLVWWNEEQRLTRFKVMVRPVKALQALVPLMARELQG